MDSLYTEREYRNFHLVHRELADPVHADHLPRVLDCREIPDFQAYWMALQYLLECLLGWRNVDFGLNWWYERGKDSGGDPRLELMQLVWDDDGQLDLYAAHMWREHFAFSSPEDMSPAEMRKACRFGSEDWWRQLKRRGSVYRHDPFYAGSNPLHLHSCCHFGLLKPKAKPEGFVKNGDMNSFRATLIVSQFTAWREELEIFGRTLTPSSSRSWHVEVFDRQVGYLGKFRQSRVTGKWFQGKHSIHMAGNADA